MKKFDYKEPKIYRDEANKKWCIIYSVKLAGEKNYIRFKEYGRTYLGYNLNSITNLKKRAQEADDVLEAVRRDLEDGIYLKEPATIKAAIEKEITDAKKRNYDECFNLYLQHKGYINPIPKKQMSTATIKAFHNNQFRPFLERKGLIEDISKITKSDILEFMNFYYLNSDQSLKWSNNTFNNRKGFLSSFFSIMVHEEIIGDNPMSKIKNKSQESTQRFEVFTVEERDLLFEYLDRTDVFMATITRLIYYAYIRETELTRLKVEDFDLSEDRITILADNAKGQKDNLPRFVFIPNPLKEALKIYLNTFDHCPDWYMFAKKYRPSSVKIGNHWQYLFRDALAALKKQYPSKFNRAGLSLYSLKHSGVTHFVRDNAAKKSTAELYQRVQEQCRHETFEMTQRYLKKLHIDTKAINENFIYN